MTKIVSAGESPARILSVDFFRGATMFILVSGYGELFNPSSSNNAIAAIGRQMDHAYWEGLTAWDLIQPFFMFIVGVAIPFSLGRKLVSGTSWKQILLKAVQRSLLLLFLGWLIGSTTEHSSFTNVLAQLSFTYLVAVLIYNLPIAWQFVVSFACILSNDLIYQIFQVSGFDQPFVADHNFGSWWDVMITGHLSEDRWVSFNALPTAAHTIWGSLAGRLLLSAKPVRKKLTWLVATGLIGLVAGYLLSAYVPLIKRTCTSSFILASGGYALLTLALCYWMIDVRKWSTGVMFFIIVGMNPLFIYMFRHAGGAKMLEELISPVTARVFGWTGPFLQHILIIFLVSLMLWGLCYFLYKRKIFIRI